jgi:penicillin amidase
MFTASWLTQPVEVLRDKHGVPAHRRPNEDDLLRTFGWTHAQDRFWQMEQARRTAQGRLAEIFGEPALEADRFCRIVGFQRAAEADEAALDATTRQAITWYAEGVNAYLTAHPGRVSAEHNLLRVPVEPWRTCRYAGRGESAGVEHERQLAKRADASAAQPTSGRLHRRGS